jgi:hypothetical protein
LSPWPGFAPAAHAPIRVVGELRRMGERFFRVGFWLHYVVLQLDHMLFPFFGVCRRFFHVGFWFYGVVFWFFHVVLWFSDVRFRG